MLENEIILGLKLLANIHIGELDWNCSNCDDGMKQQFGCYEDLLIPIKHELGDFYTCPIKFIPRQVMEWYDEHCYYQTYNIAPPYWKVSDRFWECTKVYTTEYNKLTQEKYEKKQKNSKARSTESALSTMRSTHYKDK